MIRDIARYTVLGGLFILPFLPLVVTDSLFFPFITGKNFFFRIVTEVIFAAWLILCCYDAKYRPRFSYIFAAIGALLGIMFLANAFGAAPHKSFWSNYERMEGYVMLVHLALYFIVAGSVLVRERLWNAFWNVSILAAAITTFYGFCQLSGSPSCPISQSDFRIDGHIGNAAYLAIYMLFHVFLSLWLLVQTSSLRLRVLYGILAIAFIFTLTQTATRGTTLALFGGAFLTAAYIALFERKNKIMRYVATGAVLFVLLVAGVLYSAKETDFIRNNGALNRLASVSLEEGKTRFAIWSIAWEGVKERPILGWGQENFNYVFNEHYKAELYNQEPWFDRVHNIVFDWLIAGGILGFLAYFAIIISAVYYIFVLPLLRKDEARFSVAERGVLLGLLGGYVAHNLLVFDNLISYFFFFSILALIHSEYARDIKKVTDLAVKPHHVTNMVVPAVGILLLVSLYFVNMPGIVGAGKLIDGFQATVPEVQLQHFKDAFASGSFAQQEMSEQMARVTQQLVSDETIMAKYQNAMRLTPEQAAARITEVRGAFIALAERELKAQNERAPDDARGYMFQSFLMRATGRYEEAEAALHRAIELSPEKQQMHFELGLVLTQKGDLEGAHAVFKHAFELEPRNPTARFYYAGSALALKNRTLFNELITEEYRNEYPSNEFILRSAYGAGYMDLVQDILAARVAADPENLQLRVSHAFTYYEAGNSARAAAILEEAIRDFPDFKEEGVRYIEQVRTTPFLRR